MELFLVASIITVASAGQLGSSYLPPPAIRFSGGGGSSLSLSAGYKPFSSPTAPPLAILKLNNENNGDGSYRFNYETANHITAEESGRLKTPDTSEVQGSFSYQAPDGQIISLKYIADENGFRPIGDHLPTAPPVPETILRSLEVNAAGQLNARYLPPSSTASRQVVPSASNRYLPPGGSKSGY